MAHRPLQPGNSLEAGSHSVLLTARLVEELTLLATETAASGNEVGVSFCRRPDGEVVPGKRTFGTNVATPHPRCPSGTVRVATTHTHPNQPRKEMPVPSPGDGHHVFGQHLQGKSEMECIVNVPARLRPGEDVTLRCAAVRDHIDDPRRLFRHLQALLRAQMPVYEFAAEQGKWPSEDDPRYADAYRAIAESGEVMPQIFELGPVYRLATEKE